MKLYYYFQLMRLDKPIGILLLLWPTLWALWLAHRGWPATHLLWVFIPGVILTRSAGCIFNDMADQQFDKFVARTAKRPLASGLVSRKEALGLAFFLLMLALLLVLSCNRFTIILAVLGMLWMIIYPLLKRITYLPQLGLGIAFSWGVPMAFAATRNDISSHAWFLFLTALIWPMIYDTFYAMVDKRDDLNIGVKSTAILFGGWDKFIILLLQLLFLSMLCYVGYLFQLNKRYYVFVFGAGLLFLYQQYLIRARQPEQCFKAFLNNHWVGLVIFLGISTSLGTP